MKREKERKKETHINESKMSKMKIYTHTCINNINTHNTRQVESVIKKERETEK